MKVQLRCESAYPDDILSQGKHLYEYRPPPSQSFDALNIKVVDCHSDNVLRHGSKEFLEAD